MNLPDKLKVLGLDTYTLYSESVPSRSAAALAYRGIFALAPLLLISFLVVGIFVDPRTAQDEISGMVDTVLDPESAAIVEQTVPSMFRSTESDTTFISLIGLLFLIYSASTLFTELKNALHSVWGLPTTPKKGMLGYIISQVTSILMVFLISIFVLSIIIIQIVISVLDAYVFRGELSSLSWVSLLGSLLLLALLVGLIFRFVPDVSMPWSDLWVGALMTSVLMILGIWGIGIYFSISDVGSAAGTAGAFIVLLLGGYYIAQVFLIGASFAAAYAKNFGLMVWCDLAELAGRRDGAPKALGPGSKGHRPVRTAGSWDQ